MGMQSTKSRLFGCWVDQQSGSMGQIIFSTTDTLGGERKDREEVLII